VPYVPRTRRESTPCFDAVYCRHSDVRSAKQLFGRAGYQVPVDHPQCHGFARRGERLVFLKTTIYHWEAIPLTAQFVYRIHSHWCGKGWKIPVVIIRGTLDVPDTDESELSTSEEDFSSGSDEEDLDDI
jgi:hypothetical protein